jgi:hypothetical protein
MTLETTLDTIAAYKPCESGWDKLVAGIGDIKRNKPFALSRIIEINDIQDTLWALKHTQPLEVFSRIVVTFACDCAERVLPVYEAKYPENKAPHEAIRQARLFLEPDFYAADAADAANAAYAAADAAKAAYAAADAADAANAAYAAYAAAYAATRAADATDAAAYAAAKAAYAAADAAEIEWQKARLKELLDA